MINHVATQTLDIVKQYVKHQQKTGTCGVCSIPTVSDILYDSAFAHSVCVIFNVLVVTLSNREGYPDFVPEMKCS